MGIEHTDHMRTFYGEYKEKRVLVTGGLGFIGSNLVIRLAELGARVTVIDSLVQGCGGSIDNLGSIRESLRVIVADIKTAPSFLGKLERPDVIFNLAGEVSHSRSMDEPLRDLELNALAQLVFLKTCADCFPAIRIVYAGTRQVYGKPQALPVSEDHSIQPVDFNGVHKFAACAYHLILSNLGGLDAIVLRLTNVYGPRMAVNIRQQGFLGVYLYNASMGQPIDVYGSGKQLRDPVYVDDVVDAFLRAGLASSCSRVFNVAGPQVLEIQRIAAIAAKAGGCVVRHREFPIREQAIDIGSYSADASRIADELQWYPRVRLEQGVRKALQFYKSERSETYQDQANWSSAVREQHEIDCVPRTGESTPGMPSK